MSNRDYIASQLIDQGTLLKKFNKLLDLIETTNIHCYKINCTFVHGGSNRQAYIILHSFGEITTENFVKNSYKFVYGYVNIGNTYYPITRLLNMNNDTNTMAEIIYEGLSVMARIDNKINSIVDQGEI